MSALAILTTASPLLPLSLLAATLHARWPARLFAAPQFAALVAEATLATINHRPLPQALATTGFALANIGLVAIVLNDRWLKYRTRALMHWEQFEREFHTYAKDHSQDPRDRPPTSR